MSTKKKRKRAVELRLHRGDINIVQRILNYAISHESQEWWQIIGGDGADNYVRCKHILTRIAVLKSEAT